MASRRTSMNKWDRDNLDFIMNTTNEGFDEWLDQADNDDVAYALELIRMAKAELMIQEMEFTDDVSNFTEASQLIERIKNV
jgi:hypothetical protein